MFPFGRSTGTFTFPLLSVVPVTLFPFGSVMVIGAFGIGFPVSGSFKVAVTLVVPAMLPSGFPVICDGLGFTVTCTVILLLGRYVLVPRYCATRLYLPCVLMFNGILF